MGRLYEFADVLRQRARQHHLTPDHALGRRGEDVAHRYLQRHGFIVVARNYRMSSGAGEIDLVGWEDDRLVFIEVKSRQTDDYGAPDRAMATKALQFDPGRPRVCSARRCRLGECPLRYS